MFTLRGYQADSVNAVRTSYATHHRAPLLVLPTGGGKTIVFCHIAQNAAQKGKKVLILVHRVELLRQTVDKLRSFGIRCGVIAPKNARDLTADVQVAMVQTMVRRMVYYSHFDLIITDEAHHVVAGTYMKVISYYHGVFQLGVTATPIRTDGKGLGVHCGGVYDDLVVGPSVSDLIGMDYLVEPVVFASKAPLDLTGIRKTKKGDYSSKQLADLMNKPTITGSAVHHYLDIADKVPAVAFTASVKHAEETAAEFRRANRKFYALHGKTDPVERINLIKALGDGSIHGLTSCDVISEGTDIPAIGAAMLLRPTESLGLYLQQVGRALRPCEGKSRAFVLDHAGNTFKHGFVDDDREWTLNGKIQTKRDKSDQEEKVYQCKNCYAVFNAFKKECPECGVPKEMKIKDNTPRQVEGKLEQLTKQEKLKIRYQKASENKKAQSLAALELIEKQRGYKAGWANHVFNARQKKKNARKKSA